jgi:hypothetical protein
MVERDALDDKHQFRCKAWGRGGWSREALQKFGQPKKRRRSLGMVGLISGVSMQD